MFIKEEFNCTLKICAFHGVQTILNLEETTEWVWVDSSHATLCSHTLETGMISQWVWEVGRIPADALGMNSTLPLGIAYT